MENRQLESTEQQTLIDQPSQFTNEVCPITQEKPDGNPKDFIVMSTSSGRGLHQFFYKKEALKKWVYQQALLVNKSGPITFKSPHANLPVTIGKIDELSRVYVQDPAASSGDFNHLIGCFLNNERLVLGFGIRQSLLEGCILLNVINTFLFDNTLLTNSNFVLLLLLAILFVQKVHQLFDACRGFVESLNKYVFNSEGIRSFEDLMLEVAQRYVDSLKPYTLDPSFADESRNLPCILKFN